MLGAIGRLIQRNILGDKSLDGTFVAKFGRPPSAKTKNDFPRRSAKTDGPCAEERHDGPGSAGRVVGTWRLDVADGNPVLGRRAIRRLLAAALWIVSRARCLARSRTKISAGPPRICRVCCWPTSSKNCPPIGSSRWTRFWPGWWREQYDGDRSQLEAASLLDKEDHWNAMFAELGV